MYKLVFSPVGRKNGGGYTSVPIGTDAFPPSDSSASATPYHKRKQIEGAEAERKPPKFSLPFWDKRLGGAIGLIEIKKGEILVGLPPRSGGRSRCVISASVAGFVRNRFALRQGDATSTKLICFPEARSEVVIYYLQDAF